ncbi:MAG: hypothetical protein WCO94_05435 [Verrucomicrobiota bacterium]
MVGIDPWIGMLDGKDLPLSAAAPHSLLRNRQKLFKNNEKQQQADRLENRPKAQYMVVRKKITTI